MGRGTRGEVAQVPTGHGVACRQGAQRLRLAAACWRAAAPAPGPAPSHVCPGAPGGLVAGAPRPHPAVGVSQAGLQARVGCGGGGGAQHVGCFQVGAGLCGAGGVLGLLGSSRVATWAGGGWQRQAGRPRCSEARRASDVERGGGAALPVSTCHPRPAAPCTTLESRLMRGAATQGR